MAPDALRYNSSQTIILAAIRSCKKPVAKRDLGNLDIHFYMSEGRLEITDITCIQCLVGRIRTLDKKEWAIIDRSGNQARAVFIDEWLAFTNFKFHPHHYLSQHQYIFHIPSILKLGFDVPAQHTLPLHSIQVTLSCFLRLTSQYFVYFNFEALYTNEDKFPPSYSESPLTAMDGL